MITSRILCLCNILSQEDLELVSAGALAAPAGLTKPLYCSVPKPLYCSSRRRSRSSRSCANDSRALLLLYCCFIAALLLLGKRFKTRALQKRQHHTAFSDGGGGGERGGGGGERGGGTLETLGRRGSVHVVVVESFVLLTHASLLQRLDLIFVLLAGL